MSEERNEEPAEEHTEPASTEPEPWSPSETRAPPAVARRGESRVAIALGAMLVVLIAIVLAAPFWAAAVMPLLPWAGQSERQRYDALAARVTALEQRPVAPAIDADAIKSAQAALAQRLAALEDNVAALRREAGAAVNKTALDQQAQRLDALEKAVAAIPQNSDTASIKEDLARQSQRLDAISAQSAQRDASETTAIQKIRQDMAQRGIAESELAKRLDVLEHQLHTQNGADRSGSALLLALLQMHEAVEAARPFPAEYAAFEDLAAHDPQLTAAAAPLAESARDGVASRAVLRQRLTDLADQITAIKPTAGKPKWWAPALTQLEGLVTIRRIEPSAKTGPQATIEAAHTDLAQGDLGAAVAAVGTLTGANAEAAQPWLRMARQRLAAETALSKLQALLTSRVGAPPAVAPASTSPAPRPGPDMPKTPS
ncbi:MAG: hypothetical protein JO007_16340 [Alphaproteobacteria bacterium]|nr:hypothetical protein [Alphaproteobacteria bacterium]